MSKNRSARATKARRQAKALAVRRAGEVKTDWQNTLDSFAQSIGEGSFQMLCQNGEVRTLTLDRMRAHMEADIIPDDGEPFGDFDTFLHFAYVDLEAGFLWLRPDGVWESREDYFTDRCQVSHDPGHGGDVDICTRPAGHDGYHRDDRWDAEVAQ